MSHHHHAEAGRPAELTDDLVPAGHRDAVHRDHLARHRHAVRLGDRGRPDKRRHAAVRADVHAEAGRRLRQLDRPLVRHGGGSGARALPALAALALGVLAPARRPGAVTLHCSAPLPSGAVQCWQHRSQRAGLRADVGGVLPVAGSGSTTEL